MEKDVAIRIRDISKMYKLYDKNSDRLKEALGLSKKKLYHEHYALKNVSFDVHKGETVGIIGTNGAGKSTILKIITGVLNQTDGEMTVDGRISALLELGAGFNGEYTGIENIYLNGTMMGYTREEVDEKLPTILEFADIGDFVYQPVKTYSSGMFVRLAFALAINIDPEILVVDEALSVGDVFFQAKCYKKFEEFKAAGKTILFVSHALNSITQYCDRVILLHHGEKIAEGEPKDMIDIYKKILTGAEDEVLAVEKDMEHPELDRIVLKEDKTEEALEEKTAEENSEGTEENVPEKPEKKPVDDGKYSITQDAEDSSTWKSNFTINPNVNEYGNRKATLVDFAIVDDNGRMTNAIIKGSEFTIKSKVKFHEKIKNPIFTFTFKTVNGVDVTGTNTMFEKVDVPVAKKGETYVASFKQVMNLQGGEYLLSMSCTGFEEGNLVAYHRCYDLINVSVISDKNTVGFYDMDSKTAVEKL